MTHNLVTQTRSYIALVFPDKIANSVKFKLDRIQPRKRRFTPMFPQSAPPEHGQGRVPLSLKPHLEFSDLHLQLSAAFPNTFVDIVLRS